MRHVLAIAALWATVGCTSRVRVEVPALPAVELNTNVVAVVANDRSCKPVADALASVLNAMQGIRVDPQATTRLNVNNCGHAFETEVFIDQKASSEGSQLQRRAAVRGRGHAIVTVVRDMEVLAHLIGSGTVHTVGAWSRDTADSVSMRAAVERGLVERVSDDLAEQLSPIPRMESRRIYRQASRGSDRQLHNLAVHAEVDGNFVRAHALAHAAWLENPTLERRDYADALKKLRDRSPPTP